jgi:hypothetical protein
MIKTQAIDDSTAQATVYVGDTAVISFVFDINDLMASLEDGYGVAIKILPAAEYITLEVA